MITDELLSYIRKEIEDKTSVKDIKNNLINNGWTLSDTEEAILKILNEHLSIQNNGDENISDDNFDDLTEDQIIDLDNYNLEEKIRDTHNFTLEKEVVKMPQTIGHIIESAGVMNMDKNTIKEKGISLSAQKRDLEKDTKTQIDSKGEDLIETNAGKDGNSYRSIFLGILSDVFWLVPFIGFLSAVGGFYFGFKGLKTKNRKVAVIGLYLCFLGIFLSSINGFASLYLLGQGENPFLKGIFANVSKEGEAIDKSDIKKVYEDKEKGFRMFLPQGWIVGDKSKFNSDLIFYKIDEDFSKDKNGYRANIYLNIKDVKNTPLEELEKEIKQSSLAMFKDYKIVSEESEIIDGNFSKVIEGSFTLDNKKIRNIQIFFNRGERLYLFTGVALFESGTERLLEIRKIVGSIVFF